MGKINIAVKCTIIKVINIVETNILSTEKTIYVKVNRLITEAENLQRFKKPLVETNDLAKIKNRIILRYQNDAKMMSTNM